MEEILSVSPDHFEVPFEPNKTFRLSLNLTNKLQGHVAFKVKTTAPNRYMVRPSQGYVDGGASTAVEIVLAALDEFPDKYKDKFLVQSCAVDEKVEDVTGMWKAKEAQHKKTKDQYHEHRLKCKLVAAAADRAAAAEAKGAAEAARLEEQADEPGNLPMVTPRGPPTSSPPAGAVGGGGPDAAELARLRQMQSDYEAMVKHTASLESSHRKLEKDKKEVERKLATTKTEKEAAEKKALEAEQSAQKYRSAMEEMKDAESSGLRQRAAVQGEGEPDITDDSKASDAPDGILLPLWQLVTLCCIFYMLGYFS